MTRPASPTPDDAVPPRPRRHFPLLPLAFALALLLILVDYGFVRADVARLQNALAALPRNAPTAAELQDVTKKVSDLVDEVDAVKTELGETKGKVEELEAKIDELEDALKTLRAERDAAASRPAAAPKRR